MFRITPSLTSLQNVFDCSPEPPPRSAFLQLGFFPFLFLFFAVLYHIAIPYHLRRPHSLAIFPLKTCVSPRAPSDPGSLFFFQACLLVIFPASTPDFLPLVSIAFSRPSPTFSHSCGFDPSQYLRLSGRVSPFSFFLHATSDDGPSVVSLFFKASKVSVDIFSYFSPQVPLCLLNFMLPLSAQISASSSFSLFDTVFFPPLICQISRPPSPPLVYPDFP